MKKATKAAFLKSDSQKPHTGIWGSGESGGGNCRSLTLDYNRFIEKNEVAEICNCSIAKAYKILQTLNRELKAKGMITIAGRVPRKYFYERLNIT